MADSEKRSGLVQRTLSKRIYGVARLMIKILLLMISLVAGASLLVYGASASPLDDPNTTKEVIMILGAGLLGFVWLMIKTND